MRAHASAAASSQQLRLLNNSVRFCNPLLAHPWQQGIMEYMQSIAKWSSTMRSGSGVEDKSTRILERRQ
jgi:hypothetical protein